MGRLAALLLVLGIVAYVVVQLLRPVPAVNASPAAPDHPVPGVAPALSWPAGGEAAVGVEGAGLVAAHGSQVPTPLASIAKVMAAYVVLRDHPLAAGTTGPEITVTPTAVSTYQQDVAASDSVVAVQAGEHLSERQTLEALLLPSGDNIATLLADWDAGSEAAFVRKMNAEARALGLAHTHYVDSSGVLPGSAGSATDQVRLAMAAMAMPAFRQIVSMPQATIPVAGVQYNIDSILGTDGIVGVKTGWTTDAGGCFVFAADSTVGGHPVTVMGAILHQAATASEPSALQATFDASTALLTSAQHALVGVQTITEGTTLGWLTAPWAKRVALRATRPVSLFGLPGMAVRTRIVLRGRGSPPMSAGGRVGNAIIVVGEERVVVPVVAAAALPAASLAWRLTDV